MAQDEGRFGRISEPRRCWSPPAARPVAARQIVREFVYAYAAVCPKLGRIVSLILPRADTEMMSLFLEHAAVEFADYFIIMLVDQAGWHTSKKLKIPENIRLLPQPPHSPELNPTEHVWDDLREKEIANHAFAGLDGVEEKLCEGFQRMESNPQYLRSLVGFPYLNVTL